MIVIDKENKEFLEMLMRCDIDEIYDYMESEKIEIPEKESAVWTVAMITLATAHVAGVIEDDIAYQHAMNCIIDSKREAEKREEGGLS